MIDRTTKSILIERISALVPLPGADIDESTELYSELGLRGDDAENFLMFVHERFAVNFEGFKFNGYFPFEGSALLQDVWQKISGRTYASLTLGDILRAIESKRWIDPDSQ